MPKFCIDFLQENALFFACQDTQNPQTLQLQCPDILWPFGFSGNFSNSSSVQLYLYWTTLVKSSMGLYTSPTDNFKGS